MRKVIAVASLLIGALALPARAELSLVYVNSEVLMQQYKAYESVIETFNRDIRGWEEEIERKKRDLIGIEEELKSQGLMLSDEKRAEKEMNYQRQANEYEQYVQSIWGPAGLAEQRNEELQRPLINKIQSVLVQMATDEGYDFVFDAADNNILFADPKRDITQDVVDKLNAEETGD